MVHRGGLGLQIILVLFLWVLLVGQSNPLYTSFKKVKQTNLYVCIDTTNVFPYNMYVAWAANV